MIEKNTTNAQETTEIVEETSDKKTTAETEETDSIAELKARFIDNSRTWRFASKLAKGDFIKTLLFLSVVLLFFALALFTVPGWLDSISVTAGDKLIFTGLNIGLVAISLFGTLKITVTVLVAMVCRNELEQQKENEDET